MPRQTSDLIALILTVVVAIVTVATALSILYIAITHPDQDTSKAADAIGRIISVVIAVIAGYIAGRRINGNGH